MSETIVAFFNPTHEDAPARCREISLPITWTGPNWVQCPIENAESSKSYVVVLPDNSRDFGADGATLRRFLRELRTITLIWHPHSRTWGRESIKELFGIPDGSAAHIDSEFTFSHEPEWRPDSTCSKIADLLCDRIEPGGFVDYFSRARVAKLLLKAACLIQVKLLPGSSSELVNPALDAIFKTLGDSPRRPSETLQRDIDEWRENWEACCNDRLLHGISSWYRDLMALA